MIIFLHLYEHIVIYPFCVYITKKYINSRVSIPKSLYKPKWAKKQNTSLYQYSQYGPNLQHPQIATYKSYIYFSGGGGGSTGIPNEILIFERNVTPEPKNRISTGTRLYENMTISWKYQMMVCSANQFLLVFEIKDGGKDFNKLYEIQVDQSFKNPTINSICFHYSQPIIAVGGDDTIIRFYKLSKEAPPELLWQHRQHFEPIRKIDSKQRDLFVSNDAEVAVIVDLRKKQTVRKFYRDMLEPIGSVLQAVYFYQQANERDLKLVICHYVTRHESYVTRELDNKKCMTLEISKDQSCATAKQGPYLGLACGKGATYLINTQKMQLIGKEQGHQAIITAGTVTKGRRFITGTSSCSYLIQEEGGTGMNWLYALVVWVFVVLGLGVGFGGGVGEL